MEGLGYLSHGFDRLKALKNYYLKCVHYFLARQKGIKH